MKTMPAFVAAAAAAMPPAPVPGAEDKLEAIRRTVGHLRDLQKVKEDVEERLKTVNVEIHSLQMTQLPEMFTELRITSITIPPDGNLPAQEFTLSDYFKASISSEWEADQRDAAFKYLIDEGHGDLIRTFVTVSFPKEKYAEAVAFAEAAVKGHSERTVEVARDVHWATLTSWLREQVTKYKFIPDLDKIGGIVGKIVKVKENRKKKA